MTAQLDREKLLEWLDKERFNLRRGTRTRNLTFVDRAYNQGIFMAYRQLKLKIKSGDFEQGDFDITKKIELAHKLIKKIEKENPVIMHEIVSRLDTLIKLQKAVVKIKSLEEIECQKIKKTK